jgi:hypothetical protein
LFRHCNPAQPLCILKSAFVLFMFLIYSGDRAFLTLREI